MGSVGEPTKVCILGKDSLVVHYDIWGSYIAHDLIRNVPSSTYVLVTDTNLFNQYVPSFEKCFQEAEKGFREAGGQQARLLTYQIPPGEQSKSRATKAEIEDWMLSDSLCDTKTVLIALGQYITELFLTNCQC